MSKKLTTMLAAMCVAMCVLACLFILKIAVEVKGVSPRQFRLAG